MLGSQALISVNKLADFSVSQAGTSKHGVSNHAVHRSLYLLIYEGVIIQPLDIYMDSRHD